MKRSQVVSLVLLAGVGVAAMRLAEQDPSQQEEEALVFPSAQSCIDSQLRTSADCLAAVNEAEQEAAQKAPRYAEQADCEQHHGSSCQARTANNATFFVPALAAFMMGRSSASLPVQPLYRRADQPTKEEEEQARSSGGEGRYYTGGGSSIWASSSGSPRTHVASAAARERLAMPRTIARGAAFKAPAGWGQGVASRGGFGAIGRGLSSGS